MDSVQFDQIPVPKFAIRGGFFLSQDTGKITVVFYADKDTIRYIGEKNGVFHHDATLERTTPWTARNAESVLDSYLDIGCVELGRWKPDTGWLLRRNMFSEFGIPVPAVPGPVTVKSWREEKQGEWF